MATSPYDDTVLILDLLGHLVYGKPCSILDLGSGFGRWGFLCRCHLGHGVSLTVDPSQSLRIDAVEGFRSNITPIYDCIYDHCYEGDIADVLPTLDDYDVIICSHVIEHFEKDDALRIIDLIKQKSRVLAVLAMPFGEFPQGAIHENPLEQHRSTWCHEDFSQRDCYVKAFGRNEGAAGLVVWGRNEHAKWLVRRLRRPFRAWCVGCVVNAVNTITGLCQRLFTS